MFWRSLCGISLWLMGCGGATGSAEATGGASNAQGGGSSFQGGSSSPGGSSSQGGGLLPVEASGGAFGFDPSGGGFASQGGNMQVGSDADGDGIDDSVDPDIDGDGVSNADELSAGTNAVEIDSDGDGCFDSLEPRRGECHADSYIAAASNCRSPIAQGRLVLHVSPTFTAPLDDVSVQFVVHSEFASGPSAVTITPLDVFPSDAAIIEGGRVRSLKPGAALGVIVQVTPSVPNLVVHVVVQSSSRSVLAEGVLLDRAFTGACPPVG